VRTKYLLPCSCGEEVRVDARQAGQEIRCRCGAMLDVPAMRGLAQLTPAGPEPDRGQPAPTGQTPPAPQATRAPRGASVRRRSSAWGPRQKRIFLGAVIAVAGLVMAAIFYLFRPQLVATEKLQPIQMWHLWRDLSHGIDQRPEWEEVYLESLAGFRRWMVASFILAGVGVLVMASSLLIRGRRSPRGMRRPAPRTRSPGQSAGS